MTLGVLCLVFFFLPGCTAIENLSNDSDIYYLDEINSIYGKVIAQTLPSYSVGQTTRVYPTLQQKRAIAAEAFDPQALPALAHGVAGYWYPQYLATVIIAVDRDRTNADIYGWSDLSAVNEAVGITGTYMYQMMFSAIAYGLEGENYTFNSASRLLSKLRKSGFLRIGSDEPAIVICYDFQAAAMTKTGRNIEIIVPCEGTFSYERGLLSNSTLSFPGDISSLLVSDGFRLTDGRCDGALYPTAEAYKTAARVWDYDRFNTVCLDGDRVFRREVLRTRLYSSADGREHQLFPLLYMIVLIVWSSSVFRRAMQKSVRYAALSTAIILLGWMTVRLIKFQIVDESTLGLYLWYSYSLFQLALPLVALWLAHTIVRPDDNRPPKWLFAFAALNSVIVVLVFTSHMHGFVYQIDFSKQNWAKDYGYGLGYTMIQFINYSLLGLAIVMMMIKCRRSSRKKSLVFPVAFLAVLVLYGYGYIAQAPIARDSDITMVTGLFTLLFFESALRTGLIPMNRKYTDFFTNTTLGIQIIDEDGNVAMSSATAAKYSTGILANALASHPLPLALDENTLLFTSRIRGGNALWQEDITGLNRLHEEVDESLRRLSATNALLAEEEKIKRILAEEKEKEQLMSRLETEISEYTTRLSAMAQQLENAADQAKAAANIAILLCYVKRRCNLFFREQETHAMPAGELTGYLDELAGIAAYSDQNITVSSDVREALTVRHATLFYALFHSVMDWSAQQHCPHVMTHLRAGNSSVIMRLLPYADPKNFTAGPRLLAAIALASGRFVLEDLDDGAVISLSFPQGGEVDG